MTTLLQHRPMSDPFAPNPAARYPTPPFSPPVQASTPPVTGLFAPASAASVQMMGPPQFRTSIPSSPGEFGTYSESGPSTTHSTSAARARSSHSPNMMVPLATSVDERSTSSAQAQRQRHRQSHNPSATYLNASPPKPEYLTDEYVLHPSVWSWKQANPTRQMIGFGHYVMLQTLGEGEFGKVKLGIHTEYGNQVAVKLIKKGSLEDTARASKVEREIDVLKTLKHPNIVRMHDLVQTDKIIGIVLEYAGGGELFDYILANRYLKEKDAQKLFAQLISGVDYLHKKHVVHRDLKLENLLLDQHRNIIITDFGFANRFNRAQDDLMATSCGSPCYAAPELVVSEGLYVGSAVDIWSCGVILYAMLSGYLPYDDDPDNPDGDNINLLYKYIMSTKLNFPDHLSPSAKSLLQIMLVPDPDERCRIEEIMHHPWLEAYRELFSRSVDDLEYLFEQDMYRKSQQAIREHNARRRVQREGKMAKLAMARSQSSMPGSTVTASMLDQHRRARDIKHHSAMPGTTTMPEFLNNAGRRVAAPPVNALQALSVPAPVLAVAQTSPVLADASIVMSSSTYPQPRTVNPSVPPQSPPASSAMPRTAISSEVSSAAASATAVENISMNTEPVMVPLAPSTPEKQPASSRPPLTGNKNRHTIQVEYDEEASYEQLAAGLEKKRTASDRGEASGSIDTLPPSPAPDSSPNKRVLQLQENDLDIDSASSEQSHTVDSFTQAVSDGMRTPPPSTPAAPRLLDRMPEENVEPSTPSRKGKETSPGHVASPSTPRATNADAEDIMTPRARPVRVATSKAFDTPRSGGKSHGSMPTEQNTPPPDGDVPTPSRPVVARPDLAKAPGVGRRERYRKGMSLDKFGLAKLLGSNQASSSVDVSKMPPSSGGLASNTQEQEGTQKVRKGSMRPGTAEGDGQKDKKSKRRTLQLMVNRSMSTRDSKTSSLAVPATPVGPLSARDTNSVSTPASVIPAASNKAAPSPPVVAQAGVPTGLMQDRAQSAASVVSVNDFAPRQPVNDKHQASSSAAKKVMDWFRRKSMARDTLVPFKTGGVTSDSTSSFVRIGESPERPVGDDPLTGNAAGLGAMSSTSSIAPTQEGNVDELEPVPTPDSATLPKEMSITLAVPKATTTGTRTPLGLVSNETNIVQNPASNSATDLSPTRSGTLPTTSRSKSHAPSQIQDGPSSVMLPTKVPLRSAPAKSFDESKMRIHTGLVDQSALSSKPPREVMAEVIRVLQEMGMDIKKENEFKVRCIRARRRKSGPTIGLGIGSVMSGSNSMSPFTLTNSSSTKIDSRNSALPSTPSGGLLSGGGLKGMLLRRGSSYSSTHPSNLSRSESDFLGSPSASSAGFGSPSTPGSPTFHETVYGEHSVDSGDEVKFAVELCRMKNLPGLYSLNIKRLKGGVWSFKFIYQTVLERCETLTH